MMFKMETPMPALLLVVVTLCLAYLSKIAGNLIRILQLTMKIPGPSTWKLVTVHAKGLLGKDMATYIWKMCELYKYRPWGMWTTDGYVFVVSDGETVSEIFKNKHMTNRPDLFFKPMLNYVGKGLLTLNGEEHRRHRKIAGPIFRKTHVESYLPSINSEVRKLVKNLRDIREGEIVDVRAIVESVAVNVTVAKFLPGTILQPSDIMLIVQASLNEIHLRSVNPCYYWLVHRLKKSTREMESAIKLVLAYAKDAVSYAKMAALQRINESSERKSLGSFDILASEFSGSGPDDGLGEIHAEVMTVLAAGVETTSFTLNISLLLLALHQDVQQRLFEEIESVLQAEDRPVGVDDLSQMTYLDLVIKETVRLFPAVPLIVRTVDEETTVNGITLPKGSTVVINVLAMHRDPNIFTNPLEFDPERISAERSLYTFIPFSSGFRMCPGKSQATLLLKTALCEVLRNFRVFSGERLKSVRDITTEMRYTLRLSESLLFFIRR